MVLESGTILSPSEGAAVVGGNVLVSQRICDVIFKAFGAVAASQVPHLPHACPVGCPWDEGGWMGRAA